MPSSRTESSPNLKKANVYFILPNKDHRDKIEISEKLKYVYILVFRSTEMVFQKGQQNASSTALLIIIYTFLFMPWKHASKKCMLWA